MKATARWVCAWCGAVRCGGCAQVPWHYIGKPIDAVDPPNCIFIVNQCRSPNELRVVVAQNTRIWSYTNHIFTYYLFDCCAFYTQILSHDFLIEFIIEAPVWRRCIQSRCLSHLVVCWNKSQCLEEEKSKCVLKFGEENDFKNF